MHNKKTHTQSVFPGGKVVLVFEVITFFRLSDYFLCSDGLDNQNHFVLNSL